MSHIKHIPVLLSQLAAGLNFSKDALFIDATFGAGGYSRFFLQQGVRVIAFDCDPLAKSLAQPLAQQYPENFHFIADRFSNMEQHLACYRGQISAIILDIGVSSMQLDDKERGFSFNKDGPLDMRMSQEGISACDVINQMDGAALARIFHILGEERYASSIAKKIIEERQKQPISSTRQLARLIEDMTPKSKQSPIHPATRVFQALRIYVNEELEELIAALFAAESLLAEGGCLAVVTFHSLEDRIVKRFLHNRSRKIAVSRHLPMQNSAMPSFNLAFKKAKIADNCEISDNRRARSAKLRMALRTSAPPHKPDRAIFALASLPPKSCLLLKGAN